MDMITQGKLLIPMKFGLIFIERISAVAEQGLCFGISPSYIWKDAFGERGII